MVSPTETMKRSALFWALLLAIVSLKAQDLIVTKAGDSIKCEITKVTDDIIQFRYLNSGSVERSQVSLKDVADFKYDQQGLPDPAGGVPPGKKYPRIRIGIGGGYTYRVENFRQDLDGSQDYFKKLKFGFNIEGEAGYFFKKSFGAGLRYNFFIPGKGPVIKDWFKVMDPDIISHIPGQGVD